MSRIVNKDKSSRGPQARKEPRRSQAKLPMNKEHQCQFKLRLTCEEGKHWTISKKMKHKAMHTSHPKTDPQHDRTRMVSLTQEQRELAAYAGRVSPSGSAQKIIARVTGRAPFSRQQLIHNQNKIEGGGTTKKVTDSQALVNFLKDKVNKKEARYVALYHQVTETTLLAIDKHTARKTQKQMQNEEYVDAELESAENLYLSYEKGDKSVGRIELKSAKDKISIGKAIEHLRNQLKVGKKVMLGCVWCSEDERQFFRKFPEVLMVDVTFGTNNQGRP